MSTTLTFPDLERLALDLSFEERGRLAATLLSSIDSPAPTEIAELWNAEAERRTTEVISGRVQSIPAEQVLRELKAKFP